MVGGIITCCDRMLSLTPANKKSAVRDIEILKAFFYPEICWRKIRRAVVADMAMIFRSHNDIIKIPVLNW